MAAFRSKACIVLAEHAHASFVGAFLPALAHSWLQLPGRYINDGCHDVCRTWLQLPGRHIDDQHAVWTSLMPGLGQQQQLGWQDRPSCWQVSFVKEACFSAAYLCCLWRLQQGMGTGCGIVCGEHCCCLLRRRTHPEKCSAPAACFRTVTD